IWRYHVPINAIAHIITWGICMATRWPAKADFVFNLSLQIYDSVSVSDRNLTIIALIVFSAQAANIIVV
ncbi:hypothetical protein PRIPAC_79420, partial [Pristionchus pacificus]|uniref:Uncharacterized protein n=1 Tax=Pristionchus pacificus TaxID=54126 RepID=A0A2A6BHL0_PRIPA